MRKSITVDIQDRTELLKFEIMEMSATQQEKWLMKAFLLLGKAGGTNEGISRAMAGDVSGIFGLLAGLEYEDAEPLLNQLLECCFRLTTGKDKRVVKLPVTAATLDGYVEDVRTIFKLKMESFKLNFGFFEEGNPLTSPAE